MIFGNNYNEGYDSYDEDFLAYTEADMNIIPEYALTFSESALYLAAHTDKCFNETFTSIGIDELAVFESTGSQIVYEGGTLSSLKEKLQNLWENIWRSIKGAFEHVMKKFHDMASEAKKKMYKKADLSKLKADKTYGMTHEFNIGDEEALTKYTKNGMDYANKVESTFARMAESETIDSDAVKQEENRLIEAITSTVGNAQAANVKDMAETIRGRMIGKEVKATAAWVKSNYDMMHGYVLGDKISNTLKKAYKDARKFINDRIKQVRGYKDARAKVCKSEIKVLTQINSCMTSCRGVVFDVIKRRYNEYRNIIVRVNMACGAAKTEVQHNSAFDSYSSQMDLVESLFEW